MPEEKVISNWEEIDDNTTPVVSSWDETESTTVKKKEVTKPLNNGSAKSDVSQSNSNSQSSTSNSNSVSPLINNGVVPDFKSFDPTNGFGRNKLLPIDEKKKQAVKQALGTPTTVVEPQKVKTETPIETPQYDVSGATKQQSDNTDTGLVNISQQAESKRVAQEAEKVKREQELANPNSFQNIGTSYKEKALKTTGNNDIEKMLNFGDINGNKAFVEATLDDNDRHILGVTKEIEKINNDNKIYEQQLKSGAITQEIYDAHKKENTKKSIDLNAEYVKGIQSRNSAIDDEIKQSQTKLANGYDIKMLGAQPYYEPLTTQQIDEEKKKIKTLTDLKNDVLIDVNNPIKSLEKHEGFQNAEKDGLIPSGATNTQKVRIYSYILADKAKKLATELGYNPNDVKSLMGDKFGSNTPKMFWESAKSLIFGSNPKEKEFVHTMAELQAIAPISILNKNNLNLNEGYTSNIVSSFRKSVAPMFPRNQIATDQDRNALTQEAFNQAGVNQDVNSAYTTQQGNVDKESKTIGKTVSRTAGDIFGIGVKVAGINTLLGIPGQAIEMAVGKPVIQGLDKALSTSKEAQALEYTKLSETATKTASEAKKVEDAKKVLDVAKVVTEKLPNNFLTRTIYGTLKSGVVHEIQGRVNDELKGFANFGVGSVNHLIGMPINTLGQVAIKMFGKEAPLFVEKVIQAAQSGTAMTATMAGMTVVNAARETEDMSAFKDVLDQHFGTKEKALRFVAENFLLGLALHAVNANTVSGLFKSKYDEGYSKLSPEEKAKVDDFVKDTNEKANDFETATKDAVEQVQKDDHKPLTTDKEIDDNAKALDQATNVNIQSQDFGAEAKQDAKIESAVIEIGGKIYEGKNHAEAILKAKADGQDISQVDRQAQGKFKLSDGTIIDRAESKSRFGQDRSELMIPQDENAKEANKEYAKITRKPLSKIAEKIKLDENQVTPIKPINTGQEQNNIGGVQQTPENNQGVQQGSGIGQVSGQESPAEKVEEDIKQKYPAQSILVKDSNQNTLTEDGEMRADATIEKIIGKSEDGTDAYVKLRQSGYSLDQMERKSFINFAQDRIDGKMNKSFSDWRKNTWSKDEVKPTTEVSKPVSEIAELKEKQQEKFLNEQKGENKQDNKGLFEQKTPTNKAESSAENKVKIKYGGEDKDLKGNPKKQWMLPTETSEQATKRIAGFVEASDFKGREQSAYIDKKGENIEVKLRNDNGKWNWYEPKSKKPFASFNSAKEAIKYIQEQPFWNNGELNKDGRNDAYFAKIKADYIKTELENGNILEDINDGKISATEAKLIIESAGLKVPKAVEESLKETPKTETPTTNTGVEEGSGVGGDVEAKINKVADEYLYHGTGEGAFRRIREEGLTPQGEKYLYFADKEQYAKTYAQRKGNSFGDRVLRVKKSDAYLPDENTTGGDFKIKNKINPNDIEIKHNGKWIPIQEFADENIGIMPISKAVEQSLKETTKTETTENPALKDVESTAKALEGVDEKELDKIPNWVSKKEQETKSKKVKLKDGQEITLKYLYDNTPDNKVAYILGIDKNGNQVSTVMIEQGKNGKWKGNDLEVDKKYRRKGLATAMYDYADEQGHNLTPTKSLKPDGIKFWQKRNKNRAKFITEAYHKAKADGSNPELVKAVEDLIGKPTAQTPENNIGVQQGDGQNVSNENEVAKVEENVVDGNLDFQVKDGLKEFVEDAKKEGYTKQETIDYVKDNNPEINEQDVIDTWDAVNENSNIPPTIDVETETISSDGKSVDKTLLKKRIYDNANQTEKERQEIEQKYGLKRDKIPHEEAKRIAKNIVDIYGLDNAIKKVRNGDITNGVAAEVYYLKFKDLDKEQKEAKTEEYHKIE